MWYEKIVKAISNTNSNVLFVIDPANMLDYRDIKTILNGIYDITTYPNELDLRRILRNLDRKTIIKFDEDSQIPYDLYSSHATIKIGPQDIFPLLNENVLYKVTFDQYQRIFKKYEAEKDTIFDKLSVKDTKKFLDSLLYLENIGKKERVLELIGKIKELINKTNIQLNDWGDISKFYGELKYLIDSEELDHDLNDLESVIHFKFRKFISYQYQDMIFDNLSPINSNIINFIFKQSPAVLICFDCMGFEEWKVIRTYLCKKLDLKFEEKYSFSMLPSDTAFSRTALFSGLLPVQLKEQKNLKENKLFIECLKRTFNILENDIYFKRCSNLNEIPENYAFEDYKAVGLIFSFIDEFVHGKNMNKSLIISVLEKYLEQNNLDELIQSLLDKGFYVYLSSDHGNILAKGNGTLPPKDLFKSRSRRYLKSMHKNIVEEYLTEQSILVQFTEMIGEDYLLLLTDASMFNSKGKTGLTHGGISVDEVIIPFIEVKNR